MNEGQTPIRVFIVDDHSVVRHGLRSLLDLQPDLEVVGEAENGAELLLQMADQEVDVVLLDIQMKGQNGIEVARRVSSTYPKVKVIILTTYDDKSYLEEGLEAGVSAFLLKSMSHESLPDHIRNVMEGARILSPSLVSTVVEKYQELAVEQARREQGLDSEDLAILARIAKGASNKDLSEHFFWSEATVKRRVHEILDKVGATNRAEAVAIAIRKGWI
jgi:DNA-binding NarL/FixJ family response regulator